MHLAILPVSFVHSSISILVPWVSMVSPVSTFKIGCHQPFMLLWVIHQRTLQHLQHYLFANYSAIWTVLKKNLCCSSQGITWDCNVVFEKGCFRAMLLFSHSQPPAPTAVFLALKWPRIGKCVSLCAHARTEIPNYSSGSTATKGPYSKWQQPMHREEQWVEKCKSCVAFSSCITR